MQHLVLLFSPALAVVISYLFFKKIKPLESVIAFIAGIAFNFGMSEWIKSTRVIDTEYMGYYAVGVQYYEDWDEWVEETCTDDNGQEYDCSRSVYHEARWVMVDNGGHHHAIKRQEHDAIVRYVQGTPVFKELNRDYYRNDGDMYHVHIPIDRLAIPVTRTREYPNRIKLNESLYRYEEISAAEKDSIGLYDYPEIAHYIPRHAYPTSLRAYQVAVQGIDDDDFALPMAILNGQSGEYDPRTFVFVYPDKERAIARKQIDYLQLGNFNELLVMLGTRGAEITWCETHSWEDVPRLRTAVKQWFTVNNRVDSLRNFPAWYALQIGAGLWTKKDPRDFDYIRVSFTLVQLAGLLAAQVALQALVFLYIFLVIRVIERSREYKSADEEAKNRSEVYRALTAKLLNGEKLRREEWKIFHENEDTREVYRERETRLRNSRERAVRARAVWLIACIPLLASFIPGIAMMDSFHPIFLILIIPCALCLLALPLLIAGIVLIRRTKK
jgi:hypothetical protein